MKQVFVFSTLFYSLFSFAQTPSPGPKKVTREDASSIVKPLLNQKESTLADLTLQASQAFVNKEIPYKAGITGEGKKGEFDQDPIVTFEGMDCTTYIESSLAAARTAYQREDIKRDQKVLRKFMANAKDIKYEDKKDIKYEKRNHFVEIDWLPNLQAKGYISDITKDLYPQAPFEEKVFSKKKWYEVKTEADLALHCTSPGPINELLDRWHKMGEQFPDEKAAINYIPLSAMLDPEVQKKFPKIMIFNMVKGKHTRLDPPVMVSHQGFVVRHEDGSLFFRHASTGKKVLEVPLNDYVQERMRDTTWPTLGFNFQSINDPK